MIPGRIQPYPTQWLALSDHTGPVAGALLPDLLQCGAFVLELTLPGPGATVLLHYRNDTDRPATLSVLYDHISGISLLYRQGNVAQRHHLPGPLPQGWAQARLTYQWDGPARVWVLRLEDTAGTWQCQASGPGPVPLATCDVLALCTGPKAARRDPALLWFGLCAGLPFVPPATWIGPRTPVQTPRGPVPAGDLRPGDLVSTRDHGAQPVIAMGAQSLPNRGIHAPVLLRAPYFGNQVDLLVAPGQLLLLSGSGVEYLFGEDAVLAPAAALRDGNAALSDTRRATTTCISLDLGKPALIMAGGCPVLCSPDVAISPPYRLLHGYEVLPLLSLLGRGGHRSAA